ncbi:MAG TPA: zinc-binding alcohol dehydrogenase family protein [Conexibacter sp.]|nr:zinc-binding alcohol dehydrogenase family protein [Conexibacter sp.]
MLAAVLHAYGATPRYEAFEDPSLTEAGQVVVEVAVASLNPVDVRKASGTFATGAPPLPSVVGMEGVGRVAGGDGVRVYFDAPVAPFGAMAERTLVAAEDLHELPDGIDDGLAASLGVAGLAGWLPLAWRARLQPGETVLVLGATGIVGQVAVQAARLLGAGRVVAAGRDTELLERAKALGADATVDLRAHEDLAAAFRAAAGGELHVVLDPLWRAPAVAALEALAPGGRLVQLGQSAGVEATVSSAVLRGKQLDLLGYSNFNVPAEVRREAYATLVEHAAAGRIALELERVPLRDVADAWARVQSGARRKLVLVP